MRKYNLYVPPTKEQGSYKIRITVTPNETPAAAALWHYNSARAHDGLPPLRRMPKGTTYTRLIPCTCSQDDGLHEWNCTISRAKRKVDQS